MFDTTAESAPARPYVVHQPGRGRQVPLGDAGHVTMKVEGEHSGQRVAIYEFTAPPSTAGPPLHLHRTWDEAFYVLEGEITFLVDGDKHVAPAGSCVFVPRGVLHTFWNATSHQARQLTFFTPAGIEDYFDALTVVLRNDNPAAVAEATALMSTHDMVVPGDDVVAYGSLAQNPSEG
jgi:quercetin dioxygenase-like cupin family protein